MKIILCVNSDIYGLISLKLLSDFINQHNCLLIFSDKILRKEQQEDLDLLHFIEQDFLHTMLGKNKESFFSQQLKEFNLSGKTINNINAPEVIEELKIFTPDIILSVRYGCIIKKPIIDLSRLGVVNLHSGLLPFYRGVIPTFWALLNGDREIGSSIHFINSEAIDAGPIIGSNHIQAEPNRSLIWNIASVYQSGIPALLKILENIMADHELLTSPQSNGSYYSFPTQNEIVKFKNSGFRFYDRQDYKDVLSFLV